MTPVTLTLYDRYTNEPFSFVPVTLNAAGSPITDADVDDVIYCKGNDGVYYKRVFEGSVNVAWMGCKGDYNPTTFTGTDNTSILTNKLSKLGSNFNYHFPSGNYLLNNPVKFPNGILVTGERELTNIYRGTSIGTSTGVFYQDSGADATIVDGNIYENISFYGGATLTNANNWTHLLTYAGTRNGIVRNCYFYGFRGDGIDISAGTSLSMARQNINILITGCVFDGIVANNRNGISIECCNGVTIENCLFQNIGSPVLNQSVGAIDIERNSTVTNQTDNVKIINNTFRNLTQTNIAGVSFHLFGNNLYELIPSSKNHIVSGNHFVNCYTGIGTSGTDDGGSINYYSDNVNIFNNTFIRNNNAIILGFTNDCNIYNNAFYGDIINNLFTHIVLYNNTRQRNVSIYKNTFMNVGASGMIEYYSVDGLKIYENSFYSSGKNGIVQYIDSTMPRVLDSICIYNNKFISTSTVALRLYAYQGGVNNAGNWTNNASCKIEGNIIQGNAILGSVILPYIKIDYSHYNVAMSIGTYKYGDFIEIDYNGYVYRVVCTQSGSSTFGSPVIATSYTDTHTFVVTNAYTTNIRKGMYVLIGDDPVVNRVQDVYANTVVFVNAYAGTITTNINIIASNPIFVCSNLIKKVNNQTGTVYSVVQCKGAEVITFTTKATATCTIIQDTQGALSGAEKLIVNNNTGILTVASDANTSINGTVSASIPVAAGQNIRLISISANAWVTY